MGKEIDIMDLEDISDEELAEIEREESEKSEECLYSRSTSRCISLSFIAFLLS